MGSLLGSESLLHFLKLSQEAILLFFSLSCMTLLEISQLLTMTLLLSRELIPVGPVQTLVFFCLCIQVLLVLSLNLLTLSEPIVFLS